MEDVKENCVGEFETFHSPVMGSETEGQVRSFLERRFRRRDEGGKRDNGEHGLMVRKKEEGSDTGRLSRQESRRLLISGARLLGVCLDAGKVAACERFLEELIKWNQRMNLTALRDERSIIVRHFLDSFTLVKYLPEGGSVLDIGSGAGFPGVPLKIVRPSLQVILLEASRKKTYFHRHIIRSLDLSDIESIWGRSDQGEIRTNLGSCFDVVVSRATLPLERFLREAIHFIHSNGIIIGMKGGNRKTTIPSEFSSLMLYRTVSTELPFDRLKRSLLFFRKVAPPV